MLNLDRLRLFIEVVEVGSFARAANLCGYSASTVARHIRLLERELSVRLFTRSAHHVTVTPAGELLASRAPDLLAMAIDLSEDVLRRAEEGPAVLRVGSYPSLTRGCLAGVIARHLARADDNVNVSLRDLEGSMAVHEVATGQLDVAFVDEAAPALQSCRELVEEGLTITEVGIERPVLLLHGSHRLARRPAITVTELPELSGLRWVSREVGSRDATLLERLASSARFTPTIGRRVECFEIISELVVQQRSVAVTYPLSVVPVPDLAVVPLIDAGQDARILAVQGEVHQSGVDDLVRRVRRYLATRKALTATAEWGGKGC